VPGICSVRLPPRAITQLKVQCQTGGTVHSVYHIPQGPVDGHRVQTECGTDVGVAPAALVVQSQGRADLRREAVER